MGIQSIIQVAQQSNLGKIDGILQFARCVKNFYDETNEVGNRKKFEVMILKSLNIKTAKTFIWLKINRADKLISKYRSNMPTNPNTLDTIASMTEEEIKNGIKMGKINPRTNAKLMRKYQHTLASYKMRNTNSSRTRNRNKKEKENDEVIPCVLESIGDDIMEKRVKSLEDRMDLMQKLLMKM